MEPLTLPILTRKLLAKARKDTILSHSAVSPNLEPEGSAALDYIRREVAPRSRCMRAYLGWEVPLPASILLRIIY